MESTLEVGDSPSPERAEEAVRGTGRRGEVGVSGRTGLSLLQRNACKDYGHISLMEKGVHW